MLATEHLGGDPGLVLGASAGLGLTHPQLFFAHPQRQRLAAVALDRLFGQALGLELGAALGLGLGPGARELGLALAGLGHLVLDPSLLDRSQLSQREQHRGLVAPTALHAAETRLRGSGCNQGCAPARWVKRRPPG